MRIQFLLISASIFCLAYLICPVIAQTRTETQKDASALNHWNKYSPVRFIFNLSPMVSKFSQLDILTPLYNKPTILDQGKINLIGVSPEFGLGYRRANLIFRAGPISSHIDSTSKDRYDESDSLVLADEYYLSHYSVELSYSLYYHKPSKLPVSLQIEPLIGYERFLRGYYGEIRDLKSKQQFLPYDIRVISSGLVFGGHIVLIYPSDEKKPISKYIYESTKGPFMSFSFRDFSNLQYLTVETGLVNLDFEGKTILERYAFFFRFEVFYGMLKGRTYRIGISSAPTFKTFFSQ